MEDLSKAMTNLSPERRALLELRLGRRAGKTAPEEKPPRESTAQTSAERPKCAVRSAPAVVPQTPAEEKRVPATNDSQTQFSLLYFASNEQQSNEDKYRLVIEGAKFADQHGFTAVWTPERHFHPFGGLYPNPSVMSAALAMITDRIQLRAGSVVLPLHHPIRIAEEWSLVDNLSKGRLGIAFASGWHANDFVFFPENYSNRREVTFRGIELIRRLWRGEAVTVRGGAGNELDVRIFPKPVQPELPIWVTAAGHSETFVRAGELGANLLTNLLSQSVEQVGERISAYRSALARHGHDPLSRTVTLMLHTFIGEDLQSVRETVRDPFCNYIRAFTGLLDDLVKSLKIESGREKLTQADMDSLLEFAFERYFNSSGLFGTPETCLPMINRLREIGVNEVACLIDFGVDCDSALSALQHLNTLKELSNGRRTAGEVQTYTRIPQPRAMSEALSS